MASGNQSAESSGQGDELGGHDDPDGLSPEQLLMIKMGAVEKGAPVDAQGEANDQAKAWEVQWGSKLKEVKEPDWPINMGELPPPLTVHALKQAVLTFPCGAGLG